MNPPVDSADTTMNRRRFLAATGGLGARLMLAGVAVLLADVLSGGCGGPADSGFVHVHGLSNNPADGEVYAATHTGIYRLGAGGPERVAGPVRDTMGFTILRPNRFLGSGHPGPAEPGPVNAGLIRSDDGGASWTPVSLAGQADFHTLAAVKDTVYGWDSVSRTVLRSDDTGRTWARGAVLDEVGALSWSYDLLFPDDQRGLWALAQFPGGATLAGVEHVLAALDVPPASAIDVVERLVDRSLATLDPVPDGATRYRLLDSVRAFAADRATEAGFASVAADALLSWVARVADTVAARVRGHGQAAHVALTATERATIDTALEHARIHDPEAGLRIAVGFGWAWVLLDDAAAAARLRAARTAAPAAPPNLVVTAMLLESWLEAMSGDLAQARTALDAATAFAGDDAPLQEIALWYGGFVLLQEGRLGEALADLQRCHAAFASDGSTWQEGASQLLAALVHLALGDTPAGRNACEDAIRLIEPLGDAWGLLHAEGLLGRVAQAEHRFADAARHHAHAAESAARLGFHGAAALHTANLGRAQHDGGDPAAATTLRQAIAGAEQEGDLRMLAETRVALAEVLLSSGDRATAYDLLVAADRWFTASGASEGAALASCLLATLRAEDSDADTEGAAQRSPLLR